MFQSMFQTSKTNKPKPAWVLQEENRLQKILTSIENGTSNSISFSDAMKLENQISKIYNEWPEDKPMVLFRIYCDVRDSEMIKSLSDVNNTVVPITFYKNLFDITNERYLNLINV